MSNQDPLTEPDRPGQIAPPDRVYYAEGVLLDASDFGAEQSYHRGRLARVLSYLHGSGTVAGLRVTWEPGEDENPERLRVSPGIAIDRLGRLIEVGRDWCLRLQSWYDSRTAAELNAAFDEDADVVIADVFLRFVACERGRTPAFASGPFDALDAAVPSRIRDAFDLELVPRKETNPPLPFSPWPDLVSGTPEERRENLHNALLDAWHEGTAFLDGQGNLLPDLEHPAGVDPSSVFLARVRIPASKNGGDPPERTDDDVEIDNLNRRFVYPSGALAAWLRPYELPNF